MLKAHDLRGLYAIIPTPAKPGAEQWDAADTVDLDETARVVEQLIQDGAAGLIALGTTGECATLTPDEYDAFVDCVLATVHKRVHTFIGTTALGTHEIVRRLRFVRDRGGSGTLLGLPMWQPCTVDMAVEHYATMSRAFPDVAIMVYANQRAFRFGFGAEFWYGVARQAPTVISAKFSTPATLLEFLDASERRINFVPNDNAVLRFSQLSPETTTACWATAASMGPQPSLAVMEAILAHDAERASRVAEDIAWANEPVEPIVRSAEVFASYNIQVEKIRINAAGYCNAGPIRPPYNVVPDEYRAAAEECGRRWAQLCQKYSRSGILDATQ